MSDIALPWLLFNVDYLFNCTYEINNENIFCIATDNVFATAGYNGLDWMWVSQLVDWVGLDLAKWTHVQL